MPFNHPLSHTKTSTDVIVDFDGPDDPYRPLNWPFHKKAITTVLYGLTTMGEYLGLQRVIKTILMIKNRRNLGKFDVCPS